MNRAKVDSQKETGRRDDDDELENKILWQAMPSGIRSKRAIDEIKAEVVRQHL